MQVAPEGERTPGATSLCGRPGIRTLNGVTRDGLANRLLRLWLTYRFRIQGPNAPLHIWLGMPNGPGSSHHADSVDCILRGTDRIRTDV